MIRIGDLDILCPICHKPDWCLVSPDGKFVICPRTPSDKMVGEAGFLHRIDGKAIKVKEIKKNKPISINWGNLNSIYQTNYDKYIPLLLEKKWDVTRSTLRKLGVGYNGLACTFPTFDANLQIIGIQRILPCNAKRMIKGSKLGIFIPYSFRWQENIFIVEGAHDTATLIDMGFNTIGRLSATCGANIITTLVKKHRDSIKSIIIVADNDEIGFMSAKNLSYKLDKFVECGIIVMENNIKDISDMAKIKGKQYAKKYITEAPYSIWG